MTRLFPSSRGADVIEAALLGGLLLLTYLLYRTALGADLQFDDSPNLAGLAKITDSESMLAFVFGGDAGPLGRPLSLLSFALQAPSWPVHAIDFQQVNLLLHVLNGALLTLLALRISQIFPARVPRPGLFAVAVAGLWVMQPLLASTSLMVVQRMTLISATASLIGLTLFVEGRARLGTRDRSAYLLMTTGIAGGTLLAALSKENGALLPLYAWVLEGTLLRAADLPSSRSFRVWKAVFLISPALLLAAYVGWSWEAMIAGYAQRAFDLGQRLATEAVILWEYVRQILAPTVSALGPFQDDYPIFAPTDPIAITASAAWVVAVFVAVLARTRAPLLSLAVGWYIVGHLLESTLFSLELYFEHRNYLPSIGIFALLASAPLFLHGRLQRTAVWGIAAYGLLCVWMLFQVTSLWSQPRLAAEIWAKHHPQSPRAAQYLSRQLLRENQFQRAMEEIQAASVRMPEASDLAMQVLQISCGHISSDEYQRRLQETLYRLPAMRHSHAALDSLHSMGNMALDGECGDLNSEIIGQLAHAILANPSFKAHGRARNFLHHELARLAHHRKDLGETMGHLEEAFAAHPNPETAVLMAATLASAGLPAEALEKLSEAARFTPWNPLTRSRWDGLFQDLRTVIEAAQASAGRPT